jgi:3-phenylpropionate/trans-cinnamate dioxygenase ferredoxin component
MTLVKVCAATEVREGEARRYVLGSREICVVNLGAGGFRAIGDLCSHAEAFLHEGEVDVDDETIECPRHGSTFDLNSGKPRSLPATLPVPAYDLRLENDDILIEVE